MPHSLGMLYERMTTHLGFLHSSDEYKVMALAALGKPTHVDRFLRAHPRAARWPLRDRRLRPRERRSGRRASAAAR